VDGLGATLCQLPVHEEVELLPDVSEIAANLDPDIEVLFVHLGIRTSHPRYEVLESRDLNVGAIFPHAASHDPRLGAHGSLHAFLVLFPERLEEGLNRLQHGLFGGRFLNRNRGSAENEDYDRDKRLHGCLRDSGLKGRYTRCLEMVIRLLDPFR